MSEAGHVVAITGAGGTLGAVLSRQFAGEADTDVVLSDVSESSLQATVNGLPTRRGAVETLRADVGEVAEVEAVVDLAVDRFGRLDTLISNAGVLSPNGRIHNLATEDWERAFRVNVLGAVNGIRAAVPVMRTQQSGSIVSPPRSPVSPRGPTLARTRDEGGRDPTRKGRGGRIRRDGIRVNCVCPGTFRSGIHEDLPPEAMTRSRPSIRSGWERPPTSSAPTRISQATRPAGQPGPPSWSTAATRRRRGDPWRTRRPCIRT